MRRLASWSAALVFGAELACAAHGPSAADTTQARVDAFSARADQDEQRIGAAEREAEALTRDVAQLASLYAAVEHQLAQAEAAFLAASRNYDRATAEFARARDDYAEAGRKWRVVSTTIMVAAASDMAGKWLCDGRMSRAQVRKMWKREGYDLKGQDADHIWPKSRGGMDHPWNFQRMESSLNRSLGNGLWWKIQNQPIDLLRGFAVSSLMRLQCG